MRWWFSLRFCSREPLAGCRFWLMIHTFGEAPSQARVMRHFWFGVDRRRDSGAPSEANRCDGGDVHGTDDRERRRRPGRDVDRTAYPLASPNGLISTIVRWEPNVELGGDRPLRTEKRSTQSTCPMVPGRSSCGYRCPPPVLQDVSDRTARLRQLRRHG